MSLAETCPPFHPDLCSPWCLQASSFPMPRPGRVHSSGLVSKALQSACAPFQNHQPQDPCGQLTPRHQATVPRTSSESSWHPSTILGSAKGTAAGMGVRKCPPESAGEATLPSPRVIGLCPVPSMNATFVLVLWGPLPPPCRGPALSFLSATISKTREFLGRAAGPSQSWCLPGLVPHTWDPGTQCPSIRLSFQQVERPMRGPRGPGLLEGLWGWTLGHWDMMLPPPSRGPGTAFSTSEGPRGWGCS